MRKVKLNILKFFDNLDIENRSFYSPNLEIVSGYNVWYFKNRGSKFISFENENIRFQFGSTGMRSIIFTPDGGFVLDAIIFGIKSIRRWYAKGEIGY